MIRLGTSAHHYALERTVVAGARPRRERRFSATSPTPASHLDDCHRCRLEAETYQQLKRRLSRFSGQVEPEAVDRLREFVDELTEGADA